MAGVVNSDTEIYFKIAANSEGPMLSIKEHTFKTDSHLRKTVSDSANEVEVSLMTKDISVTIYVAVFLETALWMAEKGYNTMMGILSRADDA